MPLAKEDHATGGGSSRWRLGVVLVYAMAVGNLLQFVLGVLGPILTDDLRLSRAELGALSSVYFGTGVLLSTRIGALVDRIGGRRMLVAMFLFSSASLVAIALAPSYLVLVLAVASAGVALAASNPVTNQLVAVHVPRGAQGLLLGLKQSGVQLSALIVGLVVPSLALAFGWRTVVAASATLGFLGILLVSRWIPAFSPVGGQDDATGGLRHLPAVVWWLAGYATLMGAGLAALIVYLPLYGAEEVGLSIPAAGAAAGVMGGVGIPARIIWARSVERAQSPQPALLALAILSAATVGVLIMASGMPWIIWPTSVALGATCAAWLAVAVVATVRGVDAGRAGRASGVVLAGFYLGMVSCPPVFGWTVDRTGSWIVGWSGVAGMFLLSAALVATWSNRAKKQATGLRTDRRTFLAARPPAG